MKRSTVRRWRYRLHYCNGAGKVEVANRNKASCLPTANNLEEEEKETNPATLVIYEGIWELIRERESYGNIRDADDVNGFFFFFSRSKTTDRSYELNVRYIRIYLEKIFLSPITLNNSFRLQPYFCCQPHTDLKSNNPITTSDSFS